MSNELDTLQRRESDLLERFVALTREQHDILTATPVDEGRLLGSLAERRKVLDEFETVFSRLAEMPGAESSRGKIIAALEALREQDAQNLALCSKHMGEINTQAKQMTQNRKVVTGYNKTGDGTPPQQSVFDEKK